MNKRHTRTMFLKKHYKLKTNLHRKFLNKKVDSQLQNKNIIYFGVKFPD